MNLINFVNFGSVMLTVMFCDVYDADCSTGPTQIRGTAPDFQGQSS